MRGERTWLGLGLAGAGAIATLAVSWNPRFDGLVTVGGGDAGAHADTEARAEDGTRYLEGWKLQLAQEPETLGPP